MAVITLAPMGKNGQRAGQLSNMAKDYIDQSHEYETTGFMASSLGVSIFLVETYCRNQHYNTPTRTRKKPKLSQNKQMFDADQFAKNGLF